jgi:hypothetical protein
VQAKTGNRIIHTKKRLYLTRGLNNLVPELFWKILICMRQSTLNPCLLPCRKPDENPFTDGISKDFTPLRFFLS